MKHTSVLLLAVCWFVMSAYAVSSPTGTGSGSGCPPSWYGMLKGLTIFGISPEHFCRVKSYISICTPGANAACNAADTSYLCCPLTDLSIVDHCYSNNTAGLCVPQTLSADLIFKVVSAFG